MRLILSVFIIAFFIRQAAAIPAVEGCPVISAADFTKTQLVSVLTTPQMAEPITVAPYMDAGGNVDVFYTQRGNQPNNWPSQVWLYDAESQTATMVLDISDVVGTVFEDGLVSVTLDPDFATNNWAYVFYVTYQGPKGASYRVSRFTFNGTTFNRNSETVIIDVPALPGIPQQQGYHTGGGAMFDTYGDFWFSTGDNNAGDTRFGEQSSSCLNDMRGGIIRIHPLPVAEGHTPAGPGQTYTIPEGNFKAHFAAQYPEYNDAGAVADELFVKGTRNAYSVVVHPTRRWVAWGDCGPDRGGHATHDDANVSFITEEHNLAPEPGFYGYPYYAGANLLQHDYLAQNPSVVLDINNLQNRDPVCTGASRLPPAVPATHPYNKGCAVTGPIFTYKPEFLNNPNAFPPHFHDKWMVVDWNEGWVELVTMAPDGKSAVSSDPDILPFNMAGPLDVKLGPDGALYVAEYGGLIYFTKNQFTAISKVEYTGPAITQACMDAALSTPANKALAAPKNWAAVANNIVSIQQNVPHSVRLTDILGKSVAEFEGSGMAQYDLGEVKHHGMVTVTVESALGSRSFKAVLY